MHSQRQVSAAAAMLAVSIGTLVTFIPSDSALADTIFESFENGFGAWTPHGNAYCNAWPDCPPLEYYVTPTTKQAEDGQWSLDLTAAGWLDAGIVWLERTIVLPEGTWNVQVDFNFFTPQDSNVNNANATAYIALEPPGNKLDFSYPGEINTAGWSTFTHAATLEVSQPSLAHLAVGYKLSWEGWFTYWLDSVTVSGIPPQTFGNGDVNGDGLVDVNDLLGVINTWGACTVSPPAICLGDQNLDGSINVDDLLIVVNHWSN